MDPTIKRLFRSEEDSVIAGICGGIGEYIRVDPVVVRLVFIVLSLITAVVPALLLYGLAWIIVPQRPRRYTPPPPATETVEVDPT